MLTLQLYVDSNWLLVSVGRSHSHIELIWRQILPSWNSPSCIVLCGPQNITTCKLWERSNVDQPCCVPPKPFIFVLHTAEFIPCPLQLCLQALNAYHSLHQVLVKICILLLQRPRQKESWGMVVWYMLRFKSYWASHSLVIIIHD